MSVHTGRPAPGHLAYTELTTNVDDIPLWLGVVSANPGSRAVYVLPEIYAEPDPIVRGSFLYLKNVSAFQVTLIPTGTDTVDGGVLLLVDPNETVVLVCDGVGNWVRVSAESTVQDRVINVPADYSTIQGALDSLKGQVIGNVKINITAPSSGVTVYAENLDFTGIYSKASIGQAMNPAEVPIEGYVPSPVDGLTIVGDVRYAAGMTYVQASQNNYFNTLSSVSGYVSKLGTPYGRVDLQHPAANQLRVVISSPPATNLETGEPGVLEQPEFAAAGVVVGDHLLVRSGANAWTEVTVSNVSANTLSYSGTDIPAYTAVVICPRVRIQAPSAPDLFASFLINTGVSIYGIWFTPNDAGAAALMMNQSVFVQLENCLVDDMAGLCGGSMVYATENSVWSAEDSVPCHVTVVKSGRNAFNNLEGAVCGWESHLFALDCSTGLSLSDPTATSEVSAAVIAYCGTGVSLNRNTKLSLLYYLGIYQTSSANGSVSMTRGSTLSCVTDNVEIDNTTTGRTGVTCTAGATYLVSPSPMNSSFYRGCGIAFNVQTGSQVILRAPTAQLIDTCTTGFQAQTGSRIIIGGTVTYNAVTNPRVIEIGSEYLAPNDAVTPKGVMTVTASGAIDGSVLTQLLGGVGARAMTMDPAAAVNAVTLYQGKRYVFAASTIAAHTITLVGATFIGAGVGTVATFAGVAVGESLEFIVLNATQVLVLVRTGVTVA